VAAAGKGEETRQCGAAAAAAAAAVVVVVVVVVVCAQAALCVRKVRAAVGGVGPPPVGAFLAQSRPPLATLHLMC